MGFPDKKTTEMWLDPAISTPFPPETLVIMNSLKNSEIPILNNYEISADESFWEKFPKRSVPAKASTRVNVEALRSHVEAVKSKMSCTEVSRAEKVLLDLAEGASAYQKVQLPPLNSVNSRSATENGILLTDTIATWVKKGFVAGPFDTPPLAGFRANPLAAVVRNGKVRPILNMSGPKGRSFNDNVDKKKLERLHMGNAKQFGFSLKAAGKNAKFSSLIFRTITNSCQPKKKISDCKDFVGWENGLWRRTRALEEFHLPLTLTD